MKQNYIRFYWAMKRLLRNKANFAVLEAKAIRKTPTTSITVWTSWPKIPRVN